MTSVILEKKMKASKHRPTAARVDLDAIAFNVQQVSEYSESSPLKYAVVKANAYGHKSLQ